MAATLDHEVATLWRTQDRAAKVPPFGLACTVSRRGAVKIGRPNTLLHENNSQGSTDRCPLRCTDTGWSIGSIGTDRVHCGNRADKGDCSSSH